MNAEVSGFKLFSGEVISPRICMASSSESKPRTGLGRLVDRASLERGFERRKDLAKALGMKPPSLSKILNRRTPPKPDTLLNLAATLGLRPADVFEAAGLPYAAPEDGSQAAAAPLVEELITEMRTADLNVAEVEAIRQTVRAFRKR